MAGGRLQSDSEKENRTGSLSHSRSHSSALEWTVSQELKRIPERFQRVVVAASGGPDSTALLVILSRILKRQKSFSIAAIHVNYGLRGEDSVEDQRFLEKLTHALDVPLSVFQVSESERRASGEENLQAWARSVRYAHFADLAADGMTAIVLGHHQDDLCENILMRLSRGASPSQIAGMAIWHEPFFRPLLGVPKQLILDWLARESLEFRVDRSNESDQYVRNRLRHEVFPALEALYPGFRNHWASFALSVRDLEYSAALGMETARNALVSSEGMSLEGFLKLPREEKCRLVGLCIRGNKQVPLRAIEHGLDQLSRPGRAHDWQMDIGAGVRIRASTHRVFIELDA